METVRSKSMVVTRQGSYVVYVHATDSPGDEEWDLSLRFYEAADVAQIRTLIYSEGARPDAAQRARLKAVLAGHMLPAAVLTPSVVARGAGMAIGWFNPNVHVFGPNDFDGAFRYLKATPEEGVVLRELVEKLKLELGLRPSAA